MSKQNIPFGITPLFLTNLMDVEFVLHLSFLSVFKTNAEFVSKTLFFRDWRHASVIIIACDFRMYIIRLPLPLCIQVCHLSRTWLETILHRCCWNYTGRSLKLESKNQEARISLHGICRLWRITLQYLVEDNLETFIYDAFTWLRKVLNYADYKFCSLILIILLYTHKYLFQKLKPCMKT